MREGCKTDGPFEWPEVTIKAPQPITDWPGQKVKPEPCCECNCPPELEAHNKSFKGSHFYRFYCPTCAYVAPSAASLSRAVEEWNVYQWQLKQNIKLVHVATDDFLNEGITLSRKARYRGPAPMVRV